MHLRFSQSHGKLPAALALVILASGLAASRGDDTGILGRLFRLGGGSSDSSSRPGAASSSGALPYSRGSSSAGSLGATASDSSSMAPAPTTSNFGGLPSAPVTTPPLSDGPSPRLAPRPRVSPPVTTADPVLTRLALGRSNDGTHFGMFLEVFADGTVIDSEGVHHLRPADLRSVIDAVGSGELYRIRGHCGASSTDFIEYVHVVIYERRLGRLNAHAFSYSGNPQGCDQSIRRLHAVLENLQAKLSRQTGAIGTSPSGAISGTNTPAPVDPSPISSPDASSSIPAGAAPAYGPHPAGGPVPPAVNPGPAAVIPLTPVDPSH